MYRLASRFARGTLAAAMGPVLGCATAAALAQEHASHAAHAHHEMKEQPVRLQPASAQDHHAMGHDAHQHDGHEQHAQMLKQQGYIRSEAAYEVPDVTLTNQNGQRVSLRELLADPRPVMLNYVYTSCTTICPVLSASFAQTQRALGSDARDVRLVSISIDPEHDTPARLRDYARRFRAAEGWQLLTGSLEDVVAVQKAFDAFRGDKMSHVPLTFIRAGAGDRWIRLQGFASAGELVQEYRSLASSSASSASSTAGAGRG